MLDKLLAAIKANDIKQVKGLLVAAQVILEELQKSNGVLPLEKLPLHLAVKENNQQIVELLMEKAPVFIDILDKEQCSALFYAKDEVAQYLASSKHLIKRTFDFIEKGEQVISEQPIRDKILMVLGITGVGKGTLIHYLNGSEFDYINDKGATKLVPREAIKNISVGHSTTRSDSFYPGIYSSANTDFSYVDTPGFGDSRGPAYDIASAYFKHHITTKAKEMKALLVLPYQEAICSSVGRGEVFYKSMYALRDFFKFKENSEQLSEIKKAISVVVTQVDPPRDDAATLKVTLQKKARKLEKLKEENSGHEDVSELESEIEALSDKIEEAEKIPSVRKQIIRNELIAKRSQIHDQETRELVEYIAEDYRDKTTKFEIFSKPLKVKKDTYSLIPEEKDQILSLIKDKGEFLNISKLEFGLALSAESREVVVHLAAETNVKVGQELSSSLVELGRDLIHQASDWEILSDKLKSVSSSFIPVMDKGREFFQQLQYIISPEVDKYRKHLEFFHYCNKKADFNPSIWHQHTSPIIKELDIVTSYLEPKSDLKAGTLSIEGMFITAKFVNAVAKKCEGFKTIKIWAFSKLLLDDNLEFNGTNLVMLSPFLVIDSQRKVNLKGQDVEGYEERSGKEEKQDKENMDGLDGQPGNPGGNGGSFFALAKKVIGSDMLTIDVSGGKGGNGQDGIVGADGKEGYIGLVENRAESVLIHKEKVKEDRNTIHYEYTYQSGSEAGLGGKGGAGGYGGYAGEYKVNFPVKTIKAKGERGREGKDGEDSKYETMYKGVYTYIVFNANNVGKEMVESIDTGASGGQIAGKVVGGLGIGVVAGLAIAGGAVAGGAVAGGAVAGGLAGGAAGGINAVEEHKLEWDTQIVDGLLKGVPFEALANSTDKHWKEGKIGWLILDGLGWVVGGAMRGAQEVVGGTGYLAGGAAGVVYAVAEGAVLAVSGTVEASASSGWKEKPDRIKSSKQARIQEKLSKSSIDGKKPDDQKPLDHESYCKEYKVVYSEVYQQIPHFIEQDFPEVITLGNPPDYSAS